MKGKRCSFPAFGITAVLFGVVAIACTLDSGNNGNSSSGILAPSGVTATALSKSSIKISWVEAANDATRHYNVYRRTMASGFDKDTDKRASNVDKVFYVDEVGLSPGTQYFYRITAVDKEGIESNFSEVVWAYTFDEAGKPVTQHTITFDADGGTPATQTKTVGADNILASLPTAPTKSGYTFGGWFSGKNGAGTQYTASSPAINADITVFAKWTENTPTIYTVTFDADSGNPATQTKTVNNGNTLGSLPAEPTKSGYTFGGWFSGKNGAGTQYTASSPAINANITVFAKWNTMIPEITSFKFEDFNVTGVISGATITVTVPNIVNLTELKPTIIYTGTSISPAAEVAQDFSSTKTYTVQAQNGDTKNYAVTVNVTDMTLNAAFTWIKNNPQNNAQYTIVPQGDEPLDPSDLSYSGKIGIKIILKGGQSERIVGLNSTGSLFTVGPGVTLTLDSNITLRGRSNTNSLVYVILGGALIMNDGSKIQGNTTSSGSGGGGVYAEGSFTMNGGTINGNTSSGAVGVNINGATFIMNEGTISGNHGAVGVYVRDGTFTMKGGTISSNTATYGGGALISGNNAIFTMNGGTISGNTATDGGGACIYGTGSFTMNGGTISGNTATNYGGGACIDGNGIFTMNGGTISGNTATNGGGGVYLIGTKVSFTKSSTAIIYGSDASATLKNTATKGNSYGHAVYVDVGSKKRNTTAGTGVVLDSTVNGNAGGWE